MKYLSIFVVAFAILACTVNKPISMQLIAAHLETRGLYTMCFKDGDSVLIVYHYKPKTGRQLNSVYKVTYQNGKAIIW